MCDACWQIYHYRMFLNSQISISDSKTQFWSGYSCQVSWLFQMCTQPHSPTQYCNLSSCLILPLPETPPPSVWHNPNKLTARVSIQAFAINIVFLEFFNNLCKHTKFDTKYSTVEYNCRSYYYLFLQECLQIYGEASFDTYYLFSATDFAEHIS